MSTEAFQPSGPADPPPAAGPGQAPAGRALWISGIVVGVVGLLLAIVSAALLFGGVVSAVSDELTAPLLDASGSNSVVLEPGSYLVFTDADSGFTAVSDIAVFDPSGAAVPVGTADLDEVFSRGSREFVAVAQFDAQQAGGYSVVIDGAAPGTQLVVARGLASGVADKAGWGFGILFGGLLVIVGLVLLAVGLTQRRRSRRPELAAYPAGAYQATAYPPAAYQPAPYQPVAYPPTTYPPTAYQQAPPQQPAAPVTAGPPAGWYPDPEPARPGGRRYWDGSGWTSHIA